MRYSCPLEILSDNGSENINQVVKETLDTLNIHHVTTSYYHPQSNGLIERYHCTLVDVISKKIHTDSGSWDMFLNQALAALRFGVNESTKCSLFFLLFNREVVIPIDTILKPRRKYQGQEPHKIALQNQHKAFLLVHQNRKKAKDKRNTYANRKAKDIKFQIGDPVYYKNHARKNKLHIKWQPYYRILEQTSPVTFIIKNQLDGSTTKVHAEHLRPANLNEWQIPTDKSGKQLRPAHYVVPPILSSDSDTGLSDVQNGYDFLQRKYRQECSVSSSEDDIPLAELCDKIRSRERRAKVEDAAETADTDSSTQPHALLDQAPMTSSADEAEILVD